MTIQQFREIYDGTKSYQDILSRHGQRFMALLNRRYPDEYDKLTGTNLDPYYYDSVLIELKKSIGIFDMFDQYLQVNDKVIYSTSCGSLASSVIKKFTERSVIMINGDYISLDRTYSRIYKIQ